MSTILDRARPEIRSLAPYRHAAWEPSLVRMHANEVPLRVDGDASMAGMNRYPEPQPARLLQALARLYGVSTGEVLAARGSDEAIDVLMRIFCRAGRDNIIVCPPTFGMYGVAAAIQGAAVRSVPLQAVRGFALDEEAIMAAVDEDTRLVFVCSPNNPTGNATGPAQLLQLASRLAGRALLVVDEAYIEFADVPSLCTRVAGIDNLAVLRTLSKAHGLAGARCGALVANAGLVALARKVIPPYALTELTIEAVVPLLQPAALAATQVRVQLLRRERERLAQALPGKPGILRAWPSQGNFLMVDCVDADDVLQRVRAARLIIRDVRQEGLPCSLRISVGTPEHNDRLLESLDG